MTHTLPLDIVARVQSFGQAVLAYITGHRSGTLTEHEDALFTLSRALVADVLSGMLTLALTGGTRGAAVQPQPCPQCQQRCR
jgi:hypothetical protein